MKGKGWLSAAFAETAPGVYTAAEARAGRRDRRRPLGGFFRQIMASTRRLLPWSRYAGERERRRPH